MHVLSAAVFDLGGTFWSLRVSVSPLKNPTSKPCAFADQMAWLALPPQTLEVALPPEPLLLLCTVADDLRV